MSEPHDSPHRNVWPDSTTAQRSMRCGLVALFACAKSLAVAFSWPTHMSICAAWKEKHLRALPRLQAFFRRNRGVPELLLTTSHMIGVVTSGFSASRQT
eukprot:4468131-Prymnesium_polylepis.1